MANEPAGADDILTSLGTALPDRVEVLGYDLAGDIVGRLNFGDMVFLLLAGRLPTPSQSRLTNALLVVLVEHGYTSSAVAARLIYRAAPEALQGAVAAGILGAGSVYLGASENAARLLQTALRDNPGADPATLAPRIVADLIERRQAIPGIGHPVHRPVDPRASRLLEVAREEGLDGPHCALMEAIAAEAARQTGRQLPLNVTGVIAGILSDMGLPWRLGKGFALIGRTAGLLGHLREEMEHSVADDLKDTVLRRVRYVRPQR